MFTTNPTPQFCRRLVGIAAWSVPCPAGWKKWMIHPPYPGGSRGGSSLPSQSLIQPGGIKWMSYQPYQGGSSGGSILPCQSHIQPDGRSGCSIHHVQVEAVEALAHLVGHISSLVVDMETPSHNITTPIKKKQQALGGDLCRSVMLSNSLSPGWILNYTCNLW